jgi:hypothetical protein
VPVRDTRTPVPLSSSFRLRQTAIEGSSMNQHDADVRIILRIPGNWAHPAELLERVPDGVELTPEGLVLPDGTELEWMPLLPDDQFPGIFRAACRADALQEELEVLDRYSVNIALTGPGGSLPSAAAMLRAGAAIIRAGGAGVFIDNSAVAHGGQDWLEMAEDGGVDAISYAFVNIIRGQSELSTMGMQVLGLPDLAMTSLDHPADTETMIEVIRYLCEADRPIGDGHVLADEDGARFRVVTTTGHAFEPGSPMHNPWGRFQLVSMKEIAESN